ncbi:zinc finger protein 98-like [Harmonia axyridis]|uniref:zinc finger protein 98-like n=1 Tax=Harmonia axyridis TaxID=115357 RepID=UPI001E275A07|nr:zinc finger protein 98-like [Harmonia axyridis]
MEDGFIPKHLIKPPLRKKINSQNVKSAATTKNDKDVEFKLKKAIVENSEVRRNPRRQVGEKNYEEIEEPKDDRYVYCDFCDEVFVDNCAKCGQLCYLRDEEVPMGTESRAKLTVPKNTLVVHPSPIHGFGVFAKTPLKKGMKMGPYEGKITKVESTAGYSWKLSDGRLVDAADEKFSNWMRFINCARHFEEQNVVAFQYRSNLYYRTCRDIQPGQELLVYYGHSFAQNLGIDVRKYFEPKEEQMLQNPECCPHCNYCYKDLTKLKNHLALCKWNPENFKKLPEKIYYCKFCPLATGDEEYLKRHEKRCEKEKENNKMNTDLADETEKKKFQCQHCKYSTNKRSHLKGHEMIHNTECEKKFKCEECQYSTNNKSDLKKHKRIHGRTFSFSCRLCQKGFNQTGCLNNHMYKSHLNSAEKKTLLDTLEIYDDRAKKNVIEAEFANGSKMKFVEYKCQQCTFVTIREGHLRSHLNIHRKKLMFSCFFSCEFMSAELDEIRYHLKNNCIRKTSECDICEKSAFCEMHIRKSYKNEEGYTCGICSHIFFQRSNLKKHVSSVHLGEKNYKCQLCDYSANEKGTLKRHISSVHLGEKNCKCHLCDYLTNRKGDLKRHISSIHLGEKNYKCQLCDYSTNEKGNLKRHISSVHLKEKNNKCQLCDYSTNEKGTLKKHISSIHSGEKNYKCQLCDYSTNEKGTLKKHISSIHSGEKNYKCEFCDYSANLKSFLQKHVSSVHLGEKMHKCQLCDYSTNRKEDLESHINGKHLKTNKYNCDFCDYFSFYKNQLRKHIEKRHVNI